MDQRNDEIGRGKDETPELLLLVEDDRTAARAITRIVSRQVSTVVAHRISVALTCFRARDRAVWAGAIVDVGLPDGSGIDLARALRTLAPGLPVLVITGADTREAASAALEVGAQFAYKPMPMSAIESFVAQAIESGPGQRILAAVRALARERDLSERETEVVHLATHRVPRAELARRLYVSENTVKSHVRSVLLKCDAETLDAVVRDVLHRALGPG